jgi:hypothetical protein
MEPRQRRHTSDLPVRAVTGRMSSSRAVLIARPIGFAQNLLEVVFEERLLQHAHGRKLAGFGPALFVRESRHEDDRRAVALTQLRGRCHAVSLSLEANVHEDEVGRVGGGQALGFADRVRPAYDFASELLQCITQRERDERLVIDHEHAQWLAASVPQSDGAFRIDSQMYRRLPSGGRAGAPRRS